MPTAFTIRRRRARLTLLAIVAVFLAPLVVAWLWKPTRFVNHGDLVTPARPLTNVSLRTLSGAPFELDALKSKWTMIYLGATSCGEPCQRDLYNMRQVRVAQGKDMRRVQTVWVVPVGYDASEIERIRVDHPALVVLSGDRAALAALARQLDVGSGIGRVYLVDPLGNLMMSFEPDIDPSDMLDDLKRLLKVSQIG